MSLVITFLYAASKKTPKEDGLGNILLQLPKLYYILGIFVVIGGIGLLIYAFVFANEDDKILATISSITAVLAGSILFAKGYISNLKVTDFEIIETTMFGHRKAIQWNEIKDLSFGKVSLELKITSHSTHIKAHMHLIGFQELLTKLEEKTGKTKTQIGIPN
ncbi:MAG: hypothetical protein KBT58_00145 [Bizionia sp.]|nr:hypothetical protein [Bizionia sp.]